MPFQNRLQYDRQWDIVIPATICTLLGLIGQIDLLIRVTMFWNLPNQNFNTFIAQFTLTSHDENWKVLFIDIYIDRERSDRANPTPIRSPFRWRRKCHWKNRSCGSTEFGGHRSSDSWSSKLSNLRDIPSWAKLPSTTDAGNARKSLQ